MPETDSVRATAPDARDVAATCRDAEFVQLVVAGDADALAAAAILAGACDGAGTPYHVRVVRTRSSVEATREAADESASVLPVGIDQERPASVIAHAAATELGASDPTLALVGVVAEGLVPDAAAESLLEAAAVERRPGVAAPTTDHADALAHTTLAHADFSGAPEEAAASVENVEGAAGEEEADRTVASILAIAAAGAPEAVPRAGRAIERALRPYAIDGPVATIGGFADVLGALARQAPGVGLALALGQDVRERALERWREYARAVHSGVRNARTARYDGLLRARVEGPPEPIARLLRDFRSPEPAVLAVGDGEAGIAAVEAPAGDAILAGADAVGGSALGNGTRGYARFDPSAEEAFTDAVREAL